MNKKNIEKNEQQKNFCNSKKKNLPTRIWLYFRNGLLNHTKKRAGIEGDIYELHRSWFGDLSKKKVLDLSSYAGNSLYGDPDFSLRASRLGKLYVNTRAKVERHHDPAGRPNMFYYGKMVIRNGWYVWRIKTERPRPKAKFKWHTTALLLTFIRFGNVFTRKK